MNNHDKPIKFKMNWREHKVSMPGEQADRFAFICLCALCAVLLAAGALLSFLLRWLTQ